QPARGWRTRDATQVDPTSETARGCRTCVGARSRGIAVAMNTAPRFATLVYGGLRPGEAFALKPEDLDFQDRVIRVERALSLGQIKDTKTYRDRAVEMSADLRVIPPYPPRLAQVRNPSAWLGRAAVALPNAAGHPLD